MDFEMIVGIANIISAIVGIVAIFLGIKTIKKVYNIEQMGDINQSHAGSGDNVGRDKKI